MTRRRFAELHPFADPALVEGGYTHFVWGIYDYDPAVGLPVYQPGFGIAVDVSDRPAPAPGSRVDLTRNEWTAPRAVDDLEAKGLKQHPSPTAAQWTGAAWRLLPSK